MKEYIIGVWIKNLEKREFWRVTEEKLKKITADKNLQVFARQEVDW